MIHLFRFDFKYVRNVVFLGASLSLGACWDSSLATAALNSIGQPPSPNAS